MNTSNDLLSVCCLGYKHAQFIKDNIEAIWNSDYKDIEIIVVDDGSPDNSGEILKELEAKSPIPMKVILQQNTGNIGHNFNVAWKEAKGKYITFMALDDVLKSDTISKAMDILKSDEKLAFVGASVIQAIDSEGKNCDTVSPLKLNKIKDPTINDLLDLEYNEFGAFYIQGVYFRKEVIDAVGAFDEDMTGDDIVLRTKVFNYIAKNPEWKFKILSEPLCLYRQHDSNVHLNSLRQMKIVSEYLERYWPDKENPDIFINWACRTLRQMPKEKWIDFFSLNKRALSCLTAQKVLDLFAEPDWHEKIILKIPVILTISRTKNYMIKEKKVYLTLFGKKFCIFHQKGKARQ